MTDLYRRSSLAAAGKFEPPGGGEGAATASVTWRNRPGFVVDLAIGSGDAVLAGEVIGEAKCGRDHCSSVAHGLGRTTDLFRSPDKIEYRVDAVRVGRGERRGDWVFGVVDRLERAEAFHPGGRCLTSHRGDHGDCGTYGELRGEYAYPACRTEDQEA